MKYGARLGPLSERELEEVVAEHFSRSGYRTLRNLQVRTWRPDVVAVKGDELIVVEVKGPRGDVRHAVAQAAVYATEATSAYVAVPPGNVTEWLENAAAALGIGLLTVTDRAKVRVRPERRPPRPSLLARAQRVLQAGPPPRVPESRGGRATLGRALRHPAVLNLFLRYPGREFTIREVALETRTPYATVWRVVQDLVALGVLSSKRLGPSHALSLNEKSPVVADLSRLYPIVLSPHRLAARRFSDRVRSLRDVQRAILFGSAARGTEEPTSDVDVAVVVDRLTERMKGAVRRMAVEVQDETRIAVVPTLLRAADLRSDSQFARDVLAGETLYERP